MKIVRLKTEEKVVKIRIIELSVFTDENMVYITSYITSTIIDILRKYIPLSLL